MKLFLIFIAMTLLTNHFVAGEDKTENEVGESPDVNLESAGNGPDEVESEVQTKESSNTQAKR